MQCATCGRKVTIEDDVAECIHCVDQTEDPIEASFAIVSLGDQDDEALLEATAWDSLMEKAQNSVGDTVILKVTPRTDKDDAVSIDHIKATNM